jgi:hypothetical protein
LGSFVACFGSFVFWGLGVGGFCGLALVFPVYLGAPYAFFNKVLLIYKKKINPTPNQLGGQFDFSIHKLL